MCVCVCVCARARARVCVLVHACEFVFVFVCVFISIYIYIFIFSCLLRVYVYTSQSIFDSYKQVISIHKGRSTGILFSLCKSTSIFYAQAYVCLSLRCMHYIYILRIIWMFCVYVYVLWLVYVCIFNASIPMLYALYLYSMHYVNIVCTDSIF